ncbi:MAG: MBL fold metallo-hydrolase [Gammaproteobacteria bacterium]|nr:MBL fold metallo-hydrolase [Gammaproteobacteria bacterium]
MKLTFLGATHTVTGSKYLLEINDKKILVDCGLFQGHKELRLKNWLDFPVDPASIDVVLLTHAHLDHSGYLPLLVKKGFKGHIYCSSATEDLCAILLPDSGYLQEEQAEHANKYGYSKHHPALPLYTKDDALEAMKYFCSVAFGYEFELDETTTFQFNRVGHILGASCVLIKHHNRSILFSGDLGRPNDPIVHDPVIMQGADYLVVESTYGDRLHEKIDLMDQIETIINRTVKRGGTIVVPSFAVGRAQILMYYIYQLKKAKRIPDIPVFLDSPMAISATKIYQRHAGDHKISAKLCDLICHTAHYVTTQDESKTLDQRSDSMIIISASGMATGGRVLYHIKKFGPDPKNTILFAGYQAGGTRGDKLVRGLGEVKMHGEIIPIHAEIENLHNISAHADYKETLAWLSHFTHQPQKVFITHGEIEAAKSLKQKIEKRFGWACIIPRYLQSEQL